MNLRAISEADLNGNYNEAGEFKVHAYLDKSEPVTMDMVKTSALVRIADALEEMTKPTMVWDATNALGFKTVITLGADRKSVHLTLECPDEEAANAALESLRESLKPLFEQKGGQDNG